MEHVETLYFKKKALDFWKDHNHNNQVKNDENECIFTPLINKKSNDIINKGPLKEKKYHLGQCLISNSNKLENKRLIIGYDDEINHKRNEIS